MNAIDAIRAALQLSYNWNRMLAEDMRSTPSVFPTPNGGNHAMWVVGHAVHARAGLLSMITGEPSPYHDWTSTLGGGSQPVSDPAVYPEYEELLAAWESLHKRTFETLERIGLAGLDQTPTAVPENLRNDPDFQTIGRLCVFMALHEMSHQGQLADARRAAGKKPMM
ncbi:MAG: DinB family protein [Phycisphaeraceae bacterium]|nr:DinB family protein [Phycisphaeraceae bacterium]